MLEFTLLSQECTEENLVGLALDELAREGARRMICTALEAEVSEYLARVRAARDERGHALATRNGKAQERTVQLGCGEIQVRAPRVNDRRVDDAGEPVRFQSRILPPYMRRSPNMATLLPVLYLRTHGVRARGLSTLAPGARGDFSEALTPLLGEEAARLSPATLVRLKKEWTGEYETWSKRDLSAHQYAYLWANGVYFNVRLEEDRLACLVVVGVREDGSKEVLAISDGYRESTESWKTLLRELKQRGLSEPLLAVGEGALGFWEALRELYPHTQEQRCWVHKIANVCKLCEFEDKLPKRLQPRAKSKLHDLLNAESRAAAEAELERFRRKFQAKYPKTVKCLEQDWDQLRTLYEFPAEHWIHIRTTNVIESLFATVKLRVRTTKGAGSREAGLAMAFKLAQVAEQHWRRITAPELVAQLLAGATFVDGEIVTQEEPRAVAA
ncbi:MAG: IS256 family transposase [Armatimonadetes bacterium CG_4_10_14_0_8_um_filter_66_14]|nr:MAG: IS256 family transposase [Armatimonadetes bacterium CG_4_10_14_0_8_um_filter_66_14]